MQLTVDEVKSKTAQSLKEFGEFNLDYITDSYLSSAATEFETANLPPQTVSNILFGHYPIDVTYNGQPCWQVYSDKSGQSGCQEDWIYYVPKSTWSASLNGTITCLHNGLVVPMWVFNKVK